MVTGKLSGDKVVAEGPDAKTLFEQGWYGNWENERLELDIVEAALLSERGKIEILTDEGKVGFKEFFHIAAKMDPHFMARYIVYADLRERGLPVRLGFKGSDFRVYDRGAKAGKAENVKWIVFASSEDNPCEMDYLGKAIQMAQNIRALALWAVVDNDNDVTYYVIK